jgi:3-methylcrotonyl-CoA carboxylase alpha subunit
MKRMLIANRGEIACRIIASAKSLGLETVAVYSEADAGALHVSLADHSVPIGPAKVSESYLRGDTIIEAAKLSGADAIHPGYGFLAENAAFATAAERAGLTWIGPTAKSIEDMGDKERARLLAKAAGVPILPGSPRFAPGDLAGIEPAAEEVGYPLLVKAAAGGGGIGMRLVETPDQLKQVVAATQGMAARSFGDATVYLERYIRNARHVEIQIFGFGDGRAVHLFERECSVQRRFQKIIEESPSPGLTPESRARMVDAAAALATAERYRGAGTVEFVVDGDSGAFYFLEMNTRIQVEHPVTEMITGHDLVSLQIRLARGDDLSELVQEVIEATGHAIECRIYAENPAKMFLPSPGRLERLRFPASRNGIRVDSGFRQGDVITPFYDPMIAKLIVHGTDRPSAIDKMAAALDELDIEGIAANVAFLGRVIRHPAFRHGETTTGFVDRYKSDLLG